MLVAMRVYPLAFIPSINLASLALFFTHFKISQIG